MERQRLVGPRLGDGRRRQCAGGERPGPLRRGILHHVSLVNDDPDENPYDFAIQGTGFASEPSASNLSAPETYIEDTPLDLADIVASDPDSAAVTATLTLRPSPLAA